MHLSPRCGARIGETLSDEFVDEMLTRLVTALAPGPWDVLEASTLNAAIALIASVKPQTELEALLAVQIAATGFASLKFLKLGQRHLEDAYIEVYGGYATRLMRLQLELIRALDKHRHGTKQTVEVRHLHTEPTRTTPREPGDSAASSSPSTIA